MNFEDEKKGTLTVGELKAALNEEEDTNLILYKGVDCDGTPRFRALRIEDLTIVEEK